MKFILILIAGLAITFASDFANTIIEKEFVTVNNTIATKQFEEGSAYQELAYNKKLKDTLHTTNDVLYIALMGSLTIYFGYSVYKKFKESK